MRRHRDQIKPISDINVTNLLDTAFVLIIAFMMVTPAIQHGLEIDLPEVAGETMDKDKTVTVLIAPPGLEGQEERIFLDELRVNEAELEQRLADMKIKFPELDVVIESDRTVTYETFAKALGAVKASGVTNIGLMTEPTEVEAPRP